MRQLFYSGISSLGLQRDVLAHLKCVFSLSLEHFRDSPVLKHALVLNRGHTVLIFLAKAYPRLLFATLS
jgi:hypothetical protein